VKASVCCIETLLGCIIFKRQDECDNGCGKELEIVQARILFPPRPEARVKNNVILLKELFRMSWGWRGHCGRMAVVFLL